MSRLAAALWALALGVVADDERHTPRLDPAAVAPASVGRVTVVVPARNEEGEVEDTLRRLVAQEGVALQVVAVDDQSRDATLAAMRRVAGIEVVEGVEPPAGWLGKPWACHQGVQRAMGEWLLFLDADVKLAPRALAAAVAFAAQRGAAGATAFPRLVTGTPAERVVLPVAAVIMQTTVFPAWAARRPRLDVAIGVGGFLLVRRELYAAIGGHAGVRGEVVEDLELARRAKRAGRLLPWARGDAVIHLRFYRGLGDMWRGWRKNVSRAWRGPALLAGAAGAGVGWVVLAPWVATVRGRASGAVGLAAQVATLRLVARATDVPAPYALTAPAGVAFLTAVGLASALDRVRGVGTDWRGRRLTVAGGPAAEGHTGE